MKKRVKKAAPKGVKRNPLAKSLRTPKFRVRVVKRADAYKRRAKHPEPAED